MAGNRVRVQVVEWREAEAEIRSIREAVFVREQGVPEELEWDGLDPDCLHVLAFNEKGEPVATGRLTEDGQIGRMAVLKPWRGSGTGRAVLLVLLERCREKGFSRVRLAAQTRAIGFYEKHGFRASGRVFPDAGIPHRMMFLDLLPPAGSR